MLHLKLRREDNYRQNQYCILEFKGKFESDSENDEKSLIHLGQLFKIDDKKYRLEIGVMDLIGVAQPLKSTQLVTQTVQISSDSREIVVKGIITKKIVFANRPVPDMQRANIQKRQSGINHQMFNKRETTVNENAFNQ